MATKLPLRRPSSGGLPRRLSKRSSSDIGRRTNQTKSANNEDTGQMIDKRTARKEFQAEFSEIVEKARKQFLDSEGKGASLTDQGTIGAGRVSVCLRKRPLLPKELEREEYDVISCSSTQKVAVHDCRMHADMKRKYVETYIHEFDRCFGEEVDTQQVYDEVVSNLIQQICDGGHATCLMYGQTGTGKTHTMSGIEERAATDIFETLRQTDSSKNLSVFISFIEIAGKRVCDLLNDGNEVKLCQTMEGVTEVLGARENSVLSSMALLSQIEQAKDKRATKATAINDTSSRSHAVCRIMIRDGEGSLQGQLTLVDLAGSEWNADSFKHDADMRKECAEINASLMALKECIRARASLEDERNKESQSSAPEYSDDWDNPPKSKKKPFIPYRNSKLTTMLKDIFTREDTYLTVIATVSPTPTDTEHSLATMKFARLAKEEKFDIPSSKIWYEKRIDLPTPVNKWTQEQLVDWMSRAKKGKFASVAARLPSNTDGKAILRLGMNRLIPICKNDKDLAQALFNSLRDEVKKLQRLEADQRENARTGKRMEKLGVI